MSFYGKALYLMAIIVSVTVSIYSFPSDDGLRHVGAAIGTDRSWGEIYPYSIFEQLGDYNPWFGYDALLRVMAEAAGPWAASSVGIKVGIVKFLSMVFLFIYFWLVLKRSGLPDAVDDRDGFTLAVMLIILLLVFSTKRISMIRPFAFGTFYLLYSVGQKGAMKGFLASLVLSFFYPYLSWFYCLPVAFAHYFRGDKRYAGGTTLFILLFLGAQPSSFWGFQAELFRSDAIRETIRYKISEFRPTWEYISFYVYLFLFLGLYPLFPARTRRLTCSKLLLLLYLVPGLKYVRYFIDILLPLAVVAFGRDMLNLLLAPSRRWAISWREAIYHHWMQIRPPLHEVVSGREAEKAPGKRQINLKPFIAAGYLMLLGLMAVASSRQVSQLISFKEGLAPIPSNALVLSSFNLQYKTLFLRPDLRIIPSCEIGFASRDVSTEYLEFFNSGRIAPLASETGVRYFLDNRAAYISPDTGDILRRLKETEPFTLWYVALPEEESKPDLNGTR